ncbi:MAG: class I SAM-dependent methyltransferase [Anaerolineaceae bacterium]|nr:MAG: class I SAM-dependent methyltransferase [Anaerolineaceae bacterium]
MDSLIARFDAVDDGDLKLCHARGVAYQADMRIRAPDGVNAEGENYFDHYAAMDGGAIGNEIHVRRVAFVDKYAGSDMAVLDVGIGSGEFIRSRPNTFGIDVNPKAREWLAANGKLPESGVVGFDAFTFWDVIEHVDAPHTHYFKRMADNCFLFTSLPIFDDLNRIRKSKHYKPGEHLYYWTERGFIEWMSFYRFRLLETSRFETECGRDSIGSYAFKRDLPGYHQTLDQYRRLYEPHYGTSAWIHFEPIAKEVLARNPKSILDFGCGRSDLVAHFWNDGARRVAKYDPSIPQFEQMPEGFFDLVICCDVMEHILMGDIQHVFKRIREKSRNAIFTISMRPARAKLPDGRNAHVSLMTASEWMRWIKAMFGKAERIPLQHDHLLMVRTY